MFRGITSFVWVATIGAASSTAFAGPEWVEGGNDAGRLPAGAQTPTGEGSLSRIVGELAHGDGKDGGQGDGGAAGGFFDDIEDMFRIYIDDPSNFSAIALSTAEDDEPFDPMLFLFDANGRGVLANDDASGSGLGLGYGSSMLTPHSTDGTNVRLTQPGIYYLAISEYPSNPVSKAGNIFHFGTTTEISGPDGYGGQHPIEDWTNYISGGGGSLAGAPGVIRHPWRIQLNGVRLITLNNPCNWVDNQIHLTANQPLYWSAFTGQPLGLTPFPTLFPNVPPGHPDPDGSTDRVLRGYVIAFAVNPNNEEISWNHLAGNATVVNYRDGTAWEYNAWAFQTVLTSLLDGVQPGDPGILNFDGVEYSQSFSQLLWNFQAISSNAFQGPRLVTSDTDLTLHPVTVDLRENNTGPITTKARFDIWNQNEVKFSGAERCITCWETRLMSNFGQPNHFLRSNLQTDHGKARIEGEQSPVVCNDPLFPSTFESLLGVSVQHLSFDGGLARGDAGTNLFGMGFEPAVIKYDVLASPPPTANAASKLARDGGSSSAGALAMPRCNGLPLAHSNLLGGNPQDRVSGSEKGSVLLFSKVDIRFDAAGNLVQDTFFQLTNDNTTGVDVQMYFIHMQE